jgi:hypothetical protein
LPVHEVEHLVMKALRWVTISFQCDLCTDVTGAVSLS